MRKNSGKQNRNSVRVQLVAPVPPPYGGMALQASLLERLLRQDGIDVDLLGHNQPFGAPLALVNRLPGLRGAFRLVRFSVRFWKRLGNKDVVHILAASWLHFLLVVYPAIWIARFRGKRIVLNYRAGGADHFFRWMGWFIRPVFRAADVVCTPSKFLAEVIDRRLGVPVSIVSNIVDLSRFRFRARRPFQPKMLVTRHLEAMYDVESVLRAFRAVQQEYPEATLTIAGTGSQGARLRALCEEWQLRGVRFLGYVEHAALAKLYDDCDILLNGSRVDNFPGSLIEASAAGLVVVSTMAGGIPYMYEDGKNAVLVPVGDSQGLADGVLRVLRDQELARRLALAGTQVSQQCEWRSVRRALFEVYGAPLPAGARGETAARADFAGMAGR